MRNSSVLQTLGTGPPSVEATCFRECKENQEPKICELDDFIVEWFVGGVSDFCGGCLYENITETYMSGAQFGSNKCPNCIPLDGAPRAVAVINRMFPGPSVQVIVLFLFVGVFVCWGVYFFVSFFFFS